MIVLREQVACSADGLDVAIVAGRSQRFAQRAHVHLHDVRGRVRHESPYLVEQPLFRDETALVADQVFENVVLLSAQVKVFARNGDSAGLCLDPKFFKAEAAMS